MWRFPTFFSPRARRRFRGNALNHTGHDASECTIYSARRCLDLLAASDADPEALIEQITECARVRRRGLAALELYLPKIEDRFLRKGLQIGLELTDRAEIRTVFETELRIAERQGRRTGSLASRIA